MEKLLAEHYRFLSRLFLGLWFIDGLFYLLDMYFLKETEFESLLIFFMFIFLACNIAFRRRAFTVDSELLKLDKESRESQ